MGEKTWYESANTPWLKLNYLSGCAAPPTPGDRGRKTFLTSFDPSFCSPRLQQALLSEDDDRRTPNSLRGSHFPGADERGNNRHGEERKKASGDSSPRKVPDDVKDTWRIAARIQPIEVTEVDGIVNFMTACTRHLDEEKEKEEQLEAEPLQRNVSMPLHVTHRKTVIAALAEERLASVNRFKSKVLELTDRPDEGQSKHTDAGERAEENKLSSHVYDDETLSRVLRDFNVAHKHGESLSEERKTLASEKLKQLKVLALSDHIELSPQLLSTVVSKGSRNLKVLDLSGCSLDSTLANAIGDCLRLETLDLTYCRNLKSLRFLQPLTGLASVCFASPSLEYLNFSRCGTSLTDEGAAVAVASSPKLKHHLCLLLRMLEKIDSSGNMQIGHLMLVKCRLKQLEYLSLTRSHSFNDESIFALVKNQGSNRLRVTDLRVGLRLLSKRESLRFLDAVSSHAPYGKMQYTQQELSEGVSRFRANLQEARIPPPPSCSPPRFTQLSPSNKHYVLSEVELATFRTQLCESHQRNRCARPDACPHSHCMTWQRRNPYEIIYDPHLCPGIEFRRSNSKMSLVRHCTRGRSCAYAHSKEEELYHPLMYKTKLCTVFPKCDRHYCPFAHSTEEMRHPFNNPLINYIWGSSAGLDCSDPNDMAQRWVSSPLDSLNEPLLITENTRLPSILREPLQEEPIHFSQHQQHLQLQQQQFQLQQQQFQPQQQQMAQHGVQEGWSHDLHQTPQMRSGKQLHNVTSPAVAPPPLYSFTMQQQYQHREGYPLGVAKHIGMRSTTKQAIPNSSVNQGVFFPTNASQNPQMTAQPSSHLGQNSDLVQPSKSARDAHGGETNAKAGKGRKSAAVQESLLGHPLVVQKLLPTAGSEIHEGFGGSFRANQHQTLPASSEAASATTTTASTDLQDLLDCESIRRALIMTLAQQLIGPQVNQLSVDQVLIVLDLAVKLAAQLQPTTPSVSVFSPSPAENLLRLQQMESDSPQQSSSTLINTELVASNSSASQHGKLNGNSSTGNSQSDNLLLQQQQRQHVAGASAPASHARRSAGNCAAQSAPTDNSPANTTSPASFNAQPHDIDPVASLAATHALIEQLRKLSLLDVGEEVSHGCLSPAPSLEEADTSSLSIVRGSSTAVWSTSTSPIVGGNSDLSSRYATLSVRYGDLVPTTAITAAATTFVSASSSADEASLCACPSLTIAQDLNTSTDKHQHLVHISRAAGTAADSNTGGNSGCASAAPFDPSDARGKICVSPEDRLLCEPHAAQAKKGGRGGETVCTVTTQTSTKIQPSFSSFLGGKNASPHIRGLLPSPATHGATCDEDEAPADASALTRPNNSRHFSCGGAKSAAVASSPPPPPPPPPQLQQQKGNFGGSARFSELVTVKLPQDTCLQKRAWLTGTLASARKLIDPFSPQLTTCSHSPSAGHFSSPPYCLGGGSSTEPTPAYGTRLSDSNSNSRSSFGHSIKGNSQGISRNAVHERKNSFSDGQYRQRAKVDVSEASA